MAESVLIFSGSLGLNNKLDPSRLKYDPETGTCELQLAYNVDHDSSGRVSRRKGFETTTQTANSHSLFCEGGECLFVSGTTFYKLNGDFSATALATVETGAKMRYLQINERIYYANGFQIGYVENGANHAWTVGTYYGPDTDRVFTGPPVGNRLGFHSGSIYMIQGNVAWHSEPFGFNLWDLARNFLPFEKEIRMFRPVTGGIYVSTSDQTIFLEGLLPKDLRRKPALSYPAIEDTDVSIDCQRYGAGQFLGVGALWMSSRGICMGLQDGQIFNVTEKKLTLPPALRGAAIAMETKYIALLEP